MASRAMSLGIHDINFLKETLHAQQELLQKVYNELDVERESSATAADEALSMILRLQGEKSAMEMEASQYKRIAEEKMCHAQETLEIFQELIYQKEMQIASLEFQVQAYRFKLVSMGCDDLGVCEMQYPENMLSRRNGNGETSGQSSLRRGNSVPPPLLEALSKRVSAEGARSSESSPKVMKEVKRAGSTIQREHTVGDLKTHWDEIKKLNEQVKELGSMKGSNDILTTECGNGISDSYAVELPISTPPICNPSPESLSVKSDGPETPEKMVCVQACEDSQCCTSVQDIFEVPLSYDHHQDNDSHKTEKHKLSIEEGRPRKLDSVWDEIWKSDAKEKLDWEKKPLLSPLSMSDPPKPRDTNEKTDWEKKPPLSPGIKNELPKSINGKLNEKQVLFKHSTHGVADFELLQFNRRLKQLEDERFTPRGQDENNVDMGDDELVLLKEIRDKVDSMQAEIMSWRTRKHPHRDDRSVGCFKDVMLCFWP